MSGAKYSYKVGCYAGEYAKMSVSLFVIPAKAREYVFTGVDLCVCVSVCDHDN